MGKRDAKWVQRPLLKERSPDQSEYDWVLSIKEDTVGEVIALDRVRGYGVTEGGDGFALMVYVNNGDYAAQIKRQVGMILRDCGYLPPAIVVQEIGGIRPLT